MNRKEKNIVIGLIYAYKRANMEVQLGRIVVEKMINILKESPMTNVYMREVKWDSEEVRDYIRDLLGKYAKNYKKSGRKQYEGLPNKEEITVYMEKVGGMGIKNIYNNANVGIEVNEIWSWDCTDVIWNGERRKILVIMDIASRKVIYWREVRLENGREIIESLHSGIKENGGIKLQKMHSDLGGFIGREVLEELNKEGIEASIKDKSKGQRFTNQVIERFFRTLKGEILGNIEEKLGRGVETLEEAMREGIDYYNNRREHGTFGETPRILCMNQMDMGVKEGRGRHESYSEKGKKYRRELKKEMAEYQRVEILEPVKEVQGDNIRRLTEYLRGVVTNPIKESLA